MTKDQLISNLENYVNIIRRCEVKALESHEKLNDRYFKGVADNYHDEIVDLEDLINRAKGEV
ncbi:hypothetical protein [Dehalobacterium formicoaceticum]|uniref:hypothetical protein n=1 Tax=Dehalobacterium formicoaceticum TaxID=51515 RepID=UPI000B7E4B3F|nr:hypothetical protein [Dehalobacterium formicoaceticum]